MEDWLTDVEKGMRESLRQLMKQGVEDYAEQDRKDWVVQHRAQVVATVSLIEWSRGTEVALRDAEPLEAMRRWLDLNVFQLSQLTELVRGKLSKIERKTIVALVTTDVHARDILDRMVEEKVSSPGEFTWQQQLRYEWLTTKQHVLVRQSDSAIDFGYEY